MSESIEGSHSVELRKDEPTALSYVSPSERIRIATGDLCDRCVSDQLPCSLRYEAHEEGVKVRSCAHFKAVA